MDEDLEKLLIETVKADIDGKYIGYSVIGPINKQQFNEVTGIASVRVSFKKEIHDSSEIPLEKYFTYRLSNSEIEQQWHYINSDG